MSDRTNIKITQLWGRFKSKVFRDTFVASEVAANIAAQISTMREDRGWTQGELADRVGMAQARISVLEDPEYETVSISTLKRLASAFDVGLAVRFVPFSDNLAWSVPERADHLSVPSFQADTMPAPHGSNQTRVVRLVVYAGARESRLVDLEASASSAPVADFAAGTVERKHAV